MTDYLLRASALQGFRETMKELNADADALAPARRIAGRT